MQTKRIKALLTLCVAFFLLSCVPVYAQEGGGGPGPYISFDELTYDFGDAKMGDVLEYSFSFQNTGDEPLILADVLVTCGCTAPDWPEDIIMPGERADLRVVFDTQGKSGAQNKVITVKSNAYNDSVALTIRANVAE